LVDASIYPFGYFYRRALEVSQAVEENLKAKLTRTIESNERLQDLVTNLQVTLSLHNWIFDASLSLL